MLVITEDKLWHLLEASIYVAVVTILRLIPFSAHYKLCTKMTIINLITQDPLPVYLENHGMICTLELKKSDDDLLLKLERIPDILGIDEAHCTSEQDPEGWHVHVFRSIYSNSIKGFPKDPKEATSKV